NGAGLHRALLRPDPAGRQLRGRSAALKRVAAAGARPRRCNRAPLRRFRIACDERLLQAAAGRRAVLHCLGGTTSLATAPEVGFAFDRADRDVLDVPDPTASGPDLELQVVGSMGDGPE